MPLNPDSKLLRSSLALTALFVGSFAAGCGAPAEDPAGRATQGIDIRISAGESIAQAVNRASPGDRVLVPAGVYQGGGWIENNGTASAPITIVSVDGPRAAVIQGGGESLRVGASSYLTFDGFEVRGSENNAVHVDNSHHITLRNIYAHDAGFDGDVMKVNQANNITIELSEFARPGPRPSYYENPYQECLDFVDVDDSVIRDNFIHDGGSMLMFVKGGSRNTVIERNVFSGQRAGASDPMVGLGGPTDIELLQGEQYEIINVSFRSNVVVGGLEGAVAVYDAQGAFIANNLFLDNDRTVVEFRAGNGPAGRSENVRIVDNLLVDNRGRMPEPFRLSSHGLTGLATSHNLFWNAGAALPGCELVNLAAQAGHLAANPQVRTPAAAADRATVLATARPSVGSPAYGTGLDTAAAPFGVTTDVTGALRAVVTDRGPFALTGAVAPAPAPAPAPATAATEPTAEEPAEEPAGLDLGTSIAATTGSSGSCQREPTTPDEAGNPRNEAGYIRWCWPGEAHCYCDADGDCYAEDGYEACR